MRCWSLARKSPSSRKRSSTEPYVKVVIAAAFALGLAGAHAEDGAQRMFGDDTRLCLSPDLFLYKSTNPAPIRLEGEPLRRLFANYSRFYRGPQAEVDLVLAYEKDDVVLLVPFAEGCATSLPRKIEAETWEVLSKTIWGGH
jgi:hypothetical protein